MAAVPAFSAQWAAKFKAEINASQAYRSAAKGWKWPLGLVVLAEPKQNFPASKGIVLDLEEGKARSVQVGSVEDAERCDYVITASYSQWKDVANGKLDAVRGLMLRKLKLKGNLATIIRYTRASQELTACTTRIPVAWPDEK